MSDGKALAREMMSEFPKLPRHDTYSGNTADEVLVWMEQVHDWKKKWRDRLKDA